MARLTISEKQRLRTQLLTALVPPQRERIAELADIAFMAIMTEYYGAKTLKAFAAMPAEWFNDGINYVYGKPSGSPHSKMISRRGKGFPAPRMPSNSFGFSAATQAKIDAWNTQNEAQEATVRLTGAQIDTVLESATTLAALLTALPAARDILNLPSADAPGLTAAKLNTALMARHGKASPAPRPKPPAKLGQKHAAKTTN